MFYGPGVGVGGWVFGSDNGAGREPVAALPARAPRKACAAEVLACPGPAPTPGPPDPEVPPPPGAGVGAERPGVAGGALGVEGAPEDPEEVPLEPLLVRDDEPDRA